MAVSKLILFYCAVLGTEFCPLVSAKLLDLRSRSVARSRPIKRHRGIQLYQGFAYQEPLEEGEQAEGIDTEEGETSNNDVVDEGTEEANEVLDEANDLLNEANELLATTSVAPTRLATTANALATTAAAGATAAGATGTATGGATGGTTLAAAATTEEVGLGVTRGTGTGLTSTRAALRSTRAALTGTTGLGTTLTGGTTLTPGTGITTMALNAVRSTATGATAGTTATVAAGATTLAGVTSTAAPTPAPRTTISEEEMAIMTALTPPDLTNNDIPAAHSLGGYSSEEYYTHWEKVGQSSQPYDTLVGARLFEILDEVPTKTPPPSQQFVSQTFVAQCPIIMFSDSLYIRAPTCNETMGTWVDPATDRVVLRWIVKGDGSLAFGVDSATRGEGGMTFASMQEELTLDQIEFKLMNCLGVQRWTVGEEITQVQSMGPGGSTMDISGYDPSLAGTAFFLRYQLTLANGTVRSTSDLFRMNSNTIEFTQPYNDESAGPTMASVTRNGDWVGQEWKTCDGTTRQWQVTFTETQRTYDQVATVMDPRVAIASVITMMAVRDESRDPSTGITTWARWSHLSTLFGSWIAFIVCAVLLVILCILGEHSKHADRMQKYLFRVEQVIMPRKPTIQTVPPHYGAY
mmetsp:Transcript_7372/g.13082  ORF Transcript_7372/g.13082 Transcript_7372/m.13082 type:complete len:635 (-) Transcript_7372:48-1952(-)